jgi:hypothetical protein
MATYRVTFTMMGSGVIEVEAKTRQAAEDMVFDMTTEQLIEWADFDGGLSVDDVEKN